VVGVATTAKSTNATLETESHRSTHRLQAGRPTASCLERGRQITPVRDGLSEVVAKVLTGALSYDSRHQLVTSRVSRPRCVSGLVPVPVRIRTSKAASTNDDEWRHGGDDF